MSRVILALLVLVAVASAFPQQSHQHHNCGENEEFVSCGSACEPACGDPIERPCTFQCVIGCQCKNGYLRDHTTKACVSECPQ
ncbi:hypothetical protein KPH14_007291 [Odynerus spinipes]|uniref:TIL domain-containing protein n=1 Tax=Odynerus spinipes TaxID=1348599 RepID=A0AAD9VII3_9HYME|nr:hypothetical protein KPH14_007291 [Odynerus spinipes]